MSELGEIMRTASETQRETQKNLHNTMAAVQNMASNAQSIESSTAVVSEHMVRLTEQLTMDEQNRYHHAESANQASIRLTQQLEELSDSLRLMQIAVNALTAELNGTQNDNQPE